MKNPDHVNIDNEGFLYLIFNNVDGYIEDNNEIIYLVFTSIDEE